MSSSVTRTAGAASRAISGSVTRPVFRVAPEVSPSSRASARLVHGVLFALFLYAYFGGTWQRFVFAAPFSAVWMAAVQMWVDRKPRPGFGELWLPVGIGVILVLIGTVLLLGHATRTLIHGSIFIALGFAVSWWLWLIWRIPRRIGHAERLARASLGAQVG
jgi:cytochrome b561